MVRIVAFVLMIALAAGSSVFAQERATLEKDTLTTLLGDEPAAAGQFTPEFLAAVPIQQIRTIVEQIKTTVGDMREIRAAESGYRIITDTHDLPVEITLDASGRIAGLLFKPPVANAVTLAEAVAGLDGIEGDVSYLVTRGDEVLAERQAETPIAVGSAFKLGILALMDEAIERGELSWSDVVTLKEHHISLPSGMLQTMPVGSPLTLHTAAAAMISISDNTATDVLVDVVGREALAQKLGIEVALTTHEFFILKGDSSLREEFLSASTDGKNEVLATLADKPLPKLDEPLPLHNEGIEWYISAERLCELIGSVAHLDIMAINPGVAEAADWQRVAYKGGGETGVLNMTTHVTDENGAPACAVLTVNAKAAISDLTVTSLYATLLKALKNP